MNSHNRIQKPWAIFSFFGPNLFLELTPQIYDVLTDLICSPTHGRISSINNLSSSDKTLA